MSVKVLEANEKVEAVHQKLEYKSLFLLGVQHVAAMCAGAIAVPMILGESLGLGQNEINILVSATLMMAGIGTFIQTLNIHDRVGAKLPIVEGVSFAGVSALVAVGLSYRGTDPIFGLQVMFGATILSGIFAFLVAPVFGKLLKYFPPLVSGVVVTSMGLSLIPVALRWVAGAPKSSNYLSVNNIVLALITIAIILTIQKLSKGFLGNIAILLGIFLGTLIAIPMGLADFSTLQNAGIFTINTPLQFGVPKFELTAVLSLFLVQLVIMTDATGNQINLSDICSVNPDQKTIVAGLRGHGLTSMLAGMFNSFPHSLFGQNVGIAAITGVKSRYVGTAAGIILLITSFFPKVIAILTSIPSPVLGGAGIIMFGIVAANGIKRLGTVSYDRNKNLVIVATSLGMALAPIATPQLFTNFPQWGKILFQSPVTLGTLTVLILNIVFNEFDRK
ncbi:purine permease [Cetobacterium sp. 8H]|uniref:nucleobase:cation symporter-2 family protein n=1 Tax=Cetobacterium sp. 8H TaxID=2759681 RepID=UPI00163C2458|nr:nucleobase:cation symporter-2 family protein [Cetobacterium sp. 8H]MBC2850220.1 purine permease [Cetobacterium sp. 8H]